jgi:cyclic pyranopterin phosphate synthase
MLIDQFDRQATDLRISVTDRCNYRCTYCMPHDVQWLPKPEVLTFEEIEFLARIFAEEGVDQIRLTGGEPLVRRDLPRLIEKLKKIPGIHDISLTTNGYFLTEQAQCLKDAGIERINISLDSLKRERFAEITRNDSFDRVMDGIAEAKRVGFRPIKINCVAIRGFNDDEIMDFLKWGAENGLEIRFIEFMPLDGDHNWKLSNVLTEAEILQKAQEFGRITQVQSKNPVPASAFASERSQFGVIPSVTQPFCANCSRIRLTADGKFRTCLFAVNETDLKAPLRAGAPVQNLVEIIRHAVYHKWAGHKINQPDFVQPKRAMYAIGG